MNILWLVQPGDIVTRDGSDRQLVLKVERDWEVMTVRCIRAPNNGWCKVGDEESNLIRRYSFAEGIDISLDAQSRNQRPEGTGTERESV